jgi:hypothetical protein
MPWIQFFSFLFFVWISSYLFSSSFPCSSCCPNIIELCKGLVIASFMVCQEILTHKKWRWCLMYNHLRIILESLDEKIMCENFAFEFVLFYFSILLFFLVKFNGMFLKKLCLWTTFDHYLHMSKVIWIIQSCYLHWIRFGLKPYKWCNKTMTMAN